MTAVIACGDSSAPTAVPSPSDRGAPTSTDELAPTDEPAPTADPAPTDEPAQTAEPTPEGGSADPTPTDASGAAAACAGSDDNRAFYANAAGAVDWPVYCPVLPAGWFVGNGSYTLAGGGSIVIDYRGPGGARLELSQGFVCSDADGCVPDGPDSGAAPFGGLDGTLVMGTDGRYAVVVDRGASPTWIVIGTGLDVDVFSGYVADFHLVEG